jgi:phospholipase/carboxylesterase
MALLETVEVDAGGTPDGSVIWLHGLGADGHDFEPIVPELGLGGRLRLRYLFPHAPVMPVTINGGMSMRAWYDIVSLDREGPTDENGIRQSSGQLVDLVERENERGVPYDRIVLAGFSQGGAIAAHTAIRFPHRLAGLMALSTYLPLHSKFSAEVSGTADNYFRELPIFMAHGTYDEVVPMSLGAQSRDLLETAGCKIEWHQYPMAHAVCGEEISDIRNWLVSVFGAGN